MKKDRSGLNNIEAQSHSGSPQSGEPVYLTIGKLRRPHGVKGEILMEMMTEFSENIKPGIQVLVGIKKKPCTVSSIRQANKLWLVSLLGFEDCESVEIFRNQRIYMDAAQLKPLPVGRFYQHEVIGMQVLDENREVLGEVTDILVTGANDVYVIGTDSGEELLIPAIKSVIISMDRDTNAMIVHPMDWV
jgi:16S rRNA processing protein RimM